MRLRTTGRVTLFQTTDAALLVGTPVTRIKGHSCGGNQMGRSGEGIVAFCLRHTGRHTLAEGERGKRGARARGLVGGETPRGMRCGRMRLACLAPWPVNSCAPFT